MNIGEAMQAIVDRHKARIEAVGDKQMNAERDLTEVLDLLEEYILPIVIAAKKVHDLRDAKLASGAGLDMDHIIALAEMSVALRVAGAVTNK